MTKNTNLFVKGQKVWLCYTYGGCGSARVTGRYKKKGKWIRAIIRPQYLDGSKGGNGNPNAIEIGEIKVEGYLRKLFFSWELKRKFGIRIKANDLNYINVIKCIRIAKENRKLQLLINDNKYKIDVMIIQSRNKERDLMIGKIRMQDQYVNKSVSELRKMKIFRF